MNKQIPNGVIITEVKPEDKLLGDYSFGQEIIVPDGDWTRYWPSNEKQRQEFESMCCTNFSSTTTIEIMFTEMIANKKISVGNLKWLNDNGYIDENGFINFSDRFDAIMSNTGPNGNSLDNPAQTKHAYGLIPEKMLPWVGDKVLYFDKASVTQEMLDLGKEFLKRFAINYERVQRKDFESTLKLSPLAGALYAWNGKNGDVYYRVDKSINHAIVIAKPPTLWEIGDSYEPFIKKLADDYIFLNYAYRYIITEIPHDEPIENDMPLLVKEKGDSKVYQVCADGDVMHILSPELLEKLYGKSVWNNIKELPYIAPEKKNGTLNELKGFYKLFIDLFN